MDILETCCPAGVVTYFLDAPVITKDISRPTVLCLIDQLEPEADGITGDFMELPSTNGVILELPSTNGEMNILELPSTNGEKISQALHDIKQDMQIALEIERAAIKKSFEEQIGDLAGFKEEITDRVMAEVVDLLPTPAALVDILPAPLDGSGWTIIDGVWRRAKGKRSACIAIG